MSMSKIIIVDDEPHIRNLIEMKLSGAGYEVKAFPNASLALDGAKTIFPALVITDHEMPGGMSGLDLLREIRKLDQEQGKSYEECTPVILLTGSVTVNIKMKSLLEEMRGVNIVSKPFSPKDLLRIVAQILNESPVGDRTAG